MSDRSIEEWAFKLYTTEVIDQYVMTAKLRNTARHQPCYGSESVRFQVDGNYGRPETRSARLEEMPVLTRAHKSVDAYPQERGGTVWIDDFDQAVTQVNLRQTSSNKLASAFTREVDYTLVETLEKATESSAPLAADPQELTLDLVLKIEEECSFRDMPAGETYALLGPIQWSQLLKIDEFTNADYVGDDLPWTKNMDARRFRGITWMKYNLPRDITQTSEARKVNSHFQSQDASSRDCVVWHKDAVGFVDNISPTIEAQYHSTKTSWSITGHMFMGAAILLDEGFFHVPLVETV